MYVSHLEYVCMNFKSLRLELPLFSIGLSGFYNTAKDYYSMRKKKRKMPFFKVKFLFLIEIQKVNKLFYSIFSADSESGLKNIFIVVLSKKN